MTDSSPVTERLLEAALPLVPYSGWGDATWTNAVKAAGLDIGEARRACPRTSHDLALAYEAILDREMASKMLEAADELEAMRYRDRVIRAIKTRLELADREVLRKSAAHFALPLNSADGAVAVWKTSDAIWNALNDRSDDINWYTKRMLLYGVLTSTSLFWIGDDSIDQAETWAFLDRRIEDVMRIERGKQALKKLPGYTTAMTAGGKIMDSIVTFPNPFKPKPSRPEPDKSTEVVTRIT